MLWLLHQVFPSAPSGRTLDMFFLKWQYTHIFVGYSFRFSNVFKEQYNILLLKVSSVGDL